MEKWPEGNGISAPFAGINIVRGVRVIRFALDLDRAMAFNAARHDQPVTASADVAVDPGSEPLLRGDGGSGWDGRQAIGRVQPDHPPTMAQVQ